MEYKDYYQILGVERSASADEIKAAYRKLARKYHPDVSDEADAEERFKAVNEAYDVLKDSEKRQAYDQLGANWKQGQDFRPPPGWENFGGGFGQRGSAQSGDFSDFFEQFFGNHGGFGGGQGGFRSPPRKGANRQIALTITLEEAFAGKAQTVRLPGGKSVQVKIPAGITPGKKIRLSGQGEASPNGGQPGDLLLEIHITAHRHFSLDDKNIELSLPLAPWELALGARVAVPTLAGEVSLKIPAGSQSGKKLRLKGRGLPGNPAGDQFVVLQAVTPPMNEELQALYEQMAAVAQFDPRAEM